MFIEIDGKMFSFENIELIEPDFASPEFTTITMRSGKFRTVAMNLSDVMEKLRKLKERPIPPSLKR